MPVSCRILGHRVRFWAEGEVMYWECGRRCGLEGQRTYATPAEAARYAYAFDRRDSDDLGHRAPLSLSPLRLGRRHKS